MSPTRESVSSDRVLVDMVHIAKAFGRATVLADVNLQVCAGEVHGLLGENGAGKSTLMKILAGVHRPDAGSIRVDGHERSSFSVHAAREEGISMVYQELSLVPQLSVAQNLALGREGRSLVGVVHDDSAKQRAETLLAEFDTRIRPSVRVENLKFAERQITEILKAQFGDAKVIVLDEPTASLTPREEKPLFATIARLKKAGVGVIYISHRLNEVLAITDRITVLRNGLVAGAIPTSEATVPMLVEMMSGRRVEARPSYRSSLPAGSADRGAEPGADRSAILDVQQLGGGKAVTGRRKLNEVSFRLKPGEVLGLTGLVGAGRSTLLRCLFGLERTDEGRMTLLGEGYSPTGVSTAVESGVVLIPEDRRDQGIFAGLSIEDNLTIGFPQDLATWPALVGVSPLSGKKQRTLALDLMKRLRIKATGPEQPAGELSGGNQQKIVFGKWLIRRPKLLLLDEPTAGVDVSSKNEIWQTVRQLSDEGVGVIYSSSDAEELAAICDRILVLADGQVVGELDSEAASDENAIRRAIQKHSSRGEAA
jgi:ABC-type sugar transport system ATPase subunit